MTALYKGERVDHLFELFLHSAISKRVDVDVVFVFRNFNRIRLKSDFFTKTLSSHGVPMIVLLAIIQDSAIKGDLFCCV